MFYSHRSPIDSEWWKLAKQEVVDFLQKISNDDKIDEFDDFAANLMKTLEKNFFASISTNNHSKSVLKEKAWIKSHHFRISELPTVWSVYSSDLSPLVCQHMNYKLYAELVRVRVHCATKNQNIIIIIIKYYTKNQKYYSQGW